VVRYAMERERPSGQLLTHTAILCSCCTCGRHELDTEYVGCVSRGGVHKRPAALKVPQAYVSVI
jgi:hypothetical protein